MRRHWILPGLADASALTKEERSGDGRLSTGHEAVVERAEGRLFRLLTDSRSKARMLP